MSFSTAFGPFVPTPCPSCPQVEITYHRPPNRVTRTTQELLHDGETVKVTLLLHPRDAPPMTIGNRITLSAGSSLLWFTFPGRGYEVASLYDARGRFLGHYVNLIRPPETTGTVWRLHDLFLDIWVPPSGPPETLDAAELEEARREGWIGAADAEQAWETCRQVLRQIAEGAWPPKPVASWTLESIPYLRLRQEAPGRYRAALLSGRIIGYGLYVLGSVSLTVLIFEAWRALTGWNPEPAEWGAALGVPALLLLPLALAGRLPATRWPRPLLSDEKTLLLGAVTAGIAVVMLHDTTQWRAPLAGVYGAVGLFCAIFTVCRSWYDREFPAYALAGLTICLAVLFALLG